MDYGEVILSASCIGFVLRALAGAALAAWACLSIFAAL